MTSARRTLVRAATIIMIGSVASRILGLVREQVIAALFGASGATDAFVAASTVPTIIYDLLIGGAISAALIPIFSDYADDPAQHPELARMVSALLTLAVLVLTVAVITLIAFAPALITLLGVGFAPAVRDDAIGLVRLILPTTLFMAVSGILTALLYARQRFVIPAFVTASYNASIILIALLAAPFIGLHSLILGVLVGAALQVALQLPALRGLRVRPSFHFAQPALKRALSLYVPVAFGLIVATVGIVIDRNLASRTGQGSLAVMRFATTLIQFPDGLIAVALSSAILPTLSRQAQREAREPDAYKSTLALGIKLALLAMIPATVGLIVLREPLVRLMFERGNFGVLDSERTALAFLAYAPQLPFLAIDKLLIASFYARKNTLTPNLVALASVGFYLLTALLLIEPWGMPGLAFANAVQNSSHALIMLALTWRALGGLRGFGIGRATLKIALASALMGVVAYAVVMLVGGTLLGVGAAAAAGAGSYLLLVALLRLEEVSVFGALLRDRLRPAA